MDRDPWRRWNLDNMKVAIMLSPGSKSGADAPWKNTPIWESNLRLTQEGCAERIARVGTLSQNGYGDDWSREKRAVVGPVVCRDLTAARSRQSTVAFRSNFASAGSGRGFTRHRSR